MLKKLAVPLLSFILGFISVSANAAFISTDWKSVGDKSATLDTSTGLEWLDLTHTFGKSYADVASQLSTTYVGWRLPTYAEIVKLTTNIFSPYGKSPYVANFTSSTAVAQFKAMFGSSNYSAYQVGFFKDASGTVRVTGMSDSLKHMYGLYHPYSYSVNGVGTGHGVWLVSDGGTTLSSKEDPTLNINNPNAPVHQQPVADVPVIAGAGLLGFFIFMFGVRRKC